MTDGFGIAAELSRAEGAIEQRLAFLALGDGRTVYCDSLRMTGEKRPAAISLGTLGVLNDENWIYHDGKRTLRFEGGEKIFTPKDTQNFAAASPWYNLDGLGIVCLKTTGQQVYNAHRSPARARLEQLFHLNTVPADGTSAQMVLVFYPGSGKRSNARCRQAMQAPSTVGRSDGNHVGRWESCRDRFGISLGGR